VLTGQIHIESISQLPSPNQVAGDVNWYAVHTKARHEKRVAAQFVEKHLRMFLPLLRQTHRWSDRQSKVEVPMFSCYAFIQIGQTVEERLKVLRTPGVLGFVGSERQGTPIPDEQIESLQTALSHNIPCFPHPFISAGRRVRIRGGSLDGVEGIVVRQGSDQRLVVSVELLHRSVAIRFEGYEIEAI
jgi:transcription antitermination factor NusG